MTTIKEILDLDAKATKGPLEVRVMSMRDGEEIEWSIIYDGAMSMCCFDSKPDANLFATYRTVTPVLARDLERLVKCCGGDDGYGNMRIDKNIVKEIRTTWGIAP